MVCLGCADKELIGIFTLCFVLGVVWRRGWGARPRTGRARLECVDKELIGIFTLCFVFGVVWR